MTSSKDSLIAHPFSLMLAVSTVLLWGGTSVANRYAVDTIPPIAVGGIRFGLATLFMVGWCRIVGSPLLLARGQWRAAALLGILNFLQISTFNIGLERSNASHGSLLVNSFVFWVAAYEHYFSRTIRLRSWQILGLLLAGGGCALLLTAGEESAQAIQAVRDPVSRQGDLVLLLSGMILGGKILFTKHAVRNAPVGTMILWHDLFGTLLFFLVSGLFEDHSSTAFTPTAVMALLYAGVLISGFCFGANAWLLKRHGASQVAVFSFASPVCGVALGVLLRGDRLTPWLFLSGLMVGLGILLVNLTAPRLPAEGADFPQVDAAGGVRGSSSPLREDRIKG